ncbi:MAG TPA: lysylphosphatidylglycerol synthase transmembrane domain-containing protein [Dehalococcoidia bacterium]|nr:lysylphosphatidylglycerol synthase transmembrane domain-containing protein [Dehalococcoidia bacterium]
MSLDKLRGRLLVSLVLGALVFVGLSAYADFDAVLDGLGRFRWQYLPLVLALTSANYVLRFFKWQFYLRTIGVDGFEARQSALVYFAGLGMVVTPGKVGEWLKCYLLRELHGTPFSRSAPIVIAERLTDSLGLVALGAAGLIVFGDAWPAFAVVVAGGAGLTFLARNQRLAYWVLHRLERVPVVSRFARHAEEFYASSYALLSPYALGSMTLLSVVSWGFEVLGFYAVLLGLGVEGGGDLLLKASFIMPAATLASALLLTPGGLGVAEGGITGLSQVLLDLSKGDAAVATLVIRFGTLWFGVIVGLAALALVARSLRPRPVPEAEAALAPSSEGRP